MSFPLVKVAPARTRATRWGALTARAVLGGLDELECHGPSGLVTLGDKGYQGAGGHVIIPYKARSKPTSQKAANRAHASLCGPGERASAHLKT